MFELIRTHQGYLEQSGLIFVFDFQIFFIFDGENETLLKLFASKEH